MQNYTECRSANLATVARLGEVNPLPDETAADGEGVARGRQVGHDGLLLFLECVARIWVRPFDC